MKKKKQCNFKKNALKLLPVIIGIVLVLFGLLGGIVKEETLFGLTLGSFPAALQSLEIPFKFFGVLIVAIYGIVRVVKKGDKVLLKNILILTGAGILLSWLIPVGMLSQQELMNLEYKQLGITDFGLLLYYGVYFSLDKVMFLLLGSILYYLLSKNNGYKNIISNIAKAVEGKENVFIVVTVVFLILITSVLSEILIPFLFIPFFISIFAKLKTNKITAFAATVGAVLVGMIGTPIGTSGLYFFGYQSSIALSEGYIFRLVIQAFVIVGYPLLIVLKSKNSKGKKAVAIKDPYDVKTTKTNNGIFATSYALIIFVIILFLGFIHWYNAFGIDAFANFHNKLIDLKINDLAIFSAILGSSASEIGKWDILTAYALISILIVVIAILNKSKSKDIIEAIVNGSKILIAPLAFLILSYVVFIVFYLSPVMVTVSHWAFTLTKEFNFAIATLLGFVTSVLQSDLGFSGYAITNYITSAYDKIPGLIQSVYSSTYGLAQAIAPTGGLLLFGLVLYDVEYKAWVKYIWYFILIMLIVSMMVFAFGFYDPFVMF